MSETQRERRAAVSGATSVAVVLAGGYSTRFEDADKVFAELDGRPLLSHVVSRVRESVDAVRISCRAGQATAVRRRVGDIPSTEVVTDPVPDQGPAAGVAAAVDDCDADAVAVCAADKPFVTPGLLGYLFSRLEQADTDCVVPRGFDGWLQPTQAVYRVDAIATAETGPDTSLRSVISQLDAEIVPTELVERHAPEYVFHDVNTRSDLEQAEKYCLSEHVPQP